MIRQYQNLYLIGTSHIAQQSINEVKQVIHEKKPRIIALELDKKRLPALFMKNKKPSFRDLKQFGIKGFLFNLIGAAIEKKLGKLVGTTPGSELKTAITSAEQIGAKVVLIDQDITTTLKKLTARLTWREKVQFGKELLHAVIYRKKKVSFDLKEVPNEKIVQKITNEVKKKYPSVYKTLIEDRDEHMAQALNKIMKDHISESIVAVVGVGHIKGILQRITER